MTIRTAVTALALLCLGLAVPAQAQMYAMVRADVNAPADLVPGAVVEISFVVEIDRADAGIAGMDLLVTWDPADASVSDVTEAEVWLDGAFLAEDDLDFESDADWEATFYGLSNPPGPGVQHKVLSIASDTFLGPMALKDATEGANVFPLAFEQTVDSGLAFFQGYQDAPADFTLGALGNSVQFAHLALVIERDLQDSGLCLDLAIDSLGVLNASSFLPDRIIFNATRCPESGLAQVQEVSVAAGSVNEFVMHVGELPEDPGGGNVGVDDVLLAAVLAAWGTTPGDALWDPDADLDGNGIINGLDLNELLSNTITTGGTTSDTDGSGSGTATSSGSVSRSGNVRRGEGNVWGK